MNNPEARIYKFVLDTHATEQRYEWPFIVKVLDIQVQGSVPVLWAIAYAYGVKRPYKLLRFLTGDVVYQVERHLGTVQLPDGTVLHYFAGGPGL
jgi:hypothetical protein